MSWGAVLLTQGRRPERFAAALRSLRGQRGVALDIVVVGNPWEATGLPGGVRAVNLGDNFGAAGGRNGGVGHVRGDLLFFLDDDAELGDPGVLARAEALFAADPRLGAVHLRVDALGDGPLAREWVPRLRVGDRTRPGPATTLWEGAVAVRRSAFEAVGGWPGEFFAVHEGTDLAWRLLDAGWRVHYAGDIACLHPPHVGATAHAFTPYLSARNRVFLARRHLPWPLAAVYVLSFVARTAPRLRRRATWRGYRDGLRRPCGRRKVLSLGTLWRMTRAGRPPVI